MIVQSLKLVTIITQNKRKIPITKTIIEIIIPNLHRITSKKEDINNKITIIITIEAIIDTITPIIAIAILAIITQEIIITTIENTAIIIIIISKEKISVIVIEMIITTNMEVAGIKTNIMKIIIVVIEITKIEEIIIIE